MSYILDLIFPQTCFGCGQTGHYFCPNCLDKQKTLPIEVIGNNIEGRLTLFSYKNMIKVVLKELKYHFTSDIIDEFSQLCSNRIKKDYLNLLNYWQKHSFVLMPIPLHEYRQNWRSFNQSALLGKKIATNLKLTYRDDFLKKIKIPNLKQNIKINHHELKIWMMFFILTQTFKIYPKT